MAVPSLTPHYTQGEFAAKAWEEARRYGRPVLFYRRVRGGTQRWGKSKSLPSALLRVLRGGILFGSSCHLKVLSLPAQPAARFVDQQDRLEAVKQFRFVPSPLAWVVQDGDATGSIDSSV